MISIEDSSRMITKAIKLAEQVAENYIYMGEQQHARLVRMCEVNLLVAKTCYELAVQAEKKSHDVPTPQ